MSTEEAEKEISRIMSLANSSAGSPTMFDILGIQVETASTKAVKQAFQRLVLLTHPDKVTVPRAAEAFHHVNRAYRTLSSEVLLERAKAAQLKKMSGSGSAHSAAVAAAAVAGGSDAEKERQAKAMKDKLKEEYLAAVRQQEEKDRRRQRVEEEAASAAQEKIDITLHANEWKQFRAKNAASKVENSHI